LLRNAFGVLIFCGCLAAEEPAAFKQALDPRAFSFPADHASHAGYQTEWWYVTGNAYDAAGRAFGWQFTIFRRALDPRDAAARGRTSAWAANDFYLLHLAVSDISGGRYVHEQALERGVLNAAGATDVSTVKTTSDPIAVWMKSARFERTAQGWALHASVEDCAFDFDLRETAAPVLHGLKNEEGLSRKGPRPGQASYYYSVPFLKTTGTLTLAGQRFAIASGNAWMDHEFGSNQLSVEQTGWNWYALQLDDGHALMLYVLRNKDGTVEPRSSGTWIDTAGRATHLALTDFTLTPGRTWHSAATGADYALDWTVAIPSQKTTLNVRAALDDQEFRSKESGGMHYYEGAVRVTGSVGDKAVKGDGYLEITGGSLGGRL
jgi:predicted secreted hydrolase